MIRMQECLTIFELEISSLFSHVQLVEQPDMS